MQKPPKNDLSQEIPKDILGSSTDGYEYEPTWEGMLRANIKFPFDAKYRVKGKLRSVEVLRFKYFRRKYGNLQPILQVRRKVDGVLMNLRLEKLLEPRGDATSNYYIQLWKKG